LETERLNYDAIEALALESKPRLIVAGFTAYPLLIDWARFRQIADKCGAYLMADIAHISGLVAAGVHPSPIGIADVVTTTTHKSLCGPRGAMIMTHRQDIARQVDRSVFPGEQGGPHLNTIAALALALKLASTDDFVRLQRLVVHNASRLAEKISDLGIRVVSGGSENHLLMLDMKGIRHDGISLSGDMAARILDVAGIVTNRNTIPGDRSAFASSGVRMGTVWISQLGYGDTEIDLLAKAIATVLKSCTPFAYPALGGKRKLRSKVDQEALHFARNAVEQLTGHSASIEGNTVEVRG
jgi:glycine hydroxymethyltransferase